SQGRDRLRPAGDGFVTRRSGERFTRPELERIAAHEPERLSPNVLLRPPVEAALWPTVAYAGGPAELGYLPDAEPLYRALNGVARQTASARAVSGGRVSRTSRASSSPGAPFRSASERRWRSSSLSTRASTSTPDHRGTAACRTTPFRARYNGSASGR